MTPADPAGNAVAGTNVTVSAIVSNLGLAPAFATSVEFYWADPSTGLSLATAHLIATKIVTVPALNSVQVNAPLPWVPAFVNGGHECLIVQCSSPSEGAGGLATPFAPWLDRHVGQRNVTVVAPGTQASMQLGIGNPFSRAMPFSIDVWTFGGRHEGKLDATLLTSILPNAFGGQLGVALRSMGLAIDVGAFDPAAGLEIGGLATGAPASGDGLFDPDLLRATSPSEPPAPTVRVADFELGAGEQVNLALTCENTLGGSEFMVHLVEQRINGILVGGYAIVLAG